MTNDEWRMMNGEWRMMNGEWRMVNDEWPSWRVLAMRVIRHLSFIIRHYLKNLAFGHAEEKVEAY